MHRFLSFCLLILIASTLPAETFRNPYRIPTPNGPVTVAVGDINNDGIPDIVYGDQQSPGFLHSLIAQSNYTYLPGSDIVLPANISPHCKLASLTASHNLDLICSGSDAPAPPAIAILLGHGDGTFAPANVISLPNPPTTITYSPLIAAIGDVNNDGHPDIVATDGSGRRTLIFQGDGLGNATLQTILPSNGSPSSALLRDLNGDGFLDVITSSVLYPSGNAVTVYLSDGNGAFATGVDYPNNVTAVLADLDGDGHPDLIGGMPGHLNILHGNPDGTFSSLLATVSYVSPGSNLSGPGPYVAPYDCLDINGDGIPDILARANDGFTVILGRPSIQFAPPVHYPVGSDLTLLDYFAPSAFVDMNGDGYPDLVTTGPDGIFITYGQADGTFATATTYESGATTFHATVADFNGDNIPDVVTSGDQELQLSLGRGDGTFLPATSIPGVIYPYTTIAPGLYTGSLIHGDFNGDGHQDILVAGQDNRSNLHLFLGTGNGTFTQSAQLPLANLTITTQSMVGDFNGDGRDDIAVLNYNVTPALLPVLTVFLAQPDTTFTPVSSMLQGSYPSQSISNTIAFADINGDGILDAVYASVTGVFVALGKGDGSFATGTASLPLPGDPSLQPSSIAIGDFDGDGKPDIAILLTDSSSPNTQPYLWANQLFVFYNNGYPNFSSPVTITTTPHGNNLLATADINHDGISDILYANANQEFGSGISASAGILHGQANRTLSPETSYILGNTISSLTVTDLNHDSYPDIVVSNSSLDKYANAFTVVINQQNIPTVQGSLTATPEPSQINQPFNITASLYPPTGAPPVSLSGPVTFTVDGNSAGSATLTNNAATITFATPLTIGSHELTASWPGMTNPSVTFGPITLTSTHSVAGLPVAIALNARPNPAAVGQPVTITEAVDSVNNLDPPPSGNITLTDNGTLFGTGSGTLLHFSETRGYAPGGDHTITLNYLGDALHSPASKSITLTITPIASIVTLQSSANPTNYGQPITFTASVTDNPGVAYQQVLTTGTVTLSGLPGGPITLPLPAIFHGLANTVTYTTSTLPPGVYTVTASFSGNASLNPSTSAPLTQIVSAPTTTTITVNPNPAYVTQTVTLSAAVNSPIANPTGTIQFFDGTTPLTTVPLISGSATFATALLAPGDHTITAQYSGDANNLRSTSSPITETILPSDFTLSIDPSSLTLITGHHTTLTLTATSVGVFADTIHLTIGSLPQWTTVTLTPTHFQLTPGGKATTEVYVDTDAVVGYISQTQPKHNPFSTTLVTALALILIPLTSRRTRRIPTLIVLAIAATFLIGSTGCSGMYPGSTTPGTYNIQITATGTQTPITHTLNLPLTVTK